MLPRTRFPRCCGCARAAPAYGLARRPDGAARPGEADATLAGGWLKLADGIALAALSSSETYAVLADGKMMRRLVTERRAALSRARRPRGMAIFNVLIGRPRVHTLSESAASAGSLPLHALPYQGVCQNGPSEAPKTGDIANAPLRRRLPRSVDLMFNQAVRLMDLARGSRKIRVCNSTYTVRFGVRLGGDPRLHRLSLGPFRAYGAGQGLTSAMR